jgi:hypothetical protein
MTTALNPHLDSVEALFRKLAREERRTLHESNRIDRADHFYNFCVTAHSLRDYFLKDRVLSEEESKAVRAYWNRAPFLVAVRDIANTAKHFQLSRPPATRGVRPGSSTMVDIYRDRTGIIAPVRRRVPDLTISLEDGTHYRLYDFMDAVVTYWRNFLKANGIRVRRQSFASLTGISAKGKSRHVE